MLPSPTPEHPPHDKVGEHHQPCQRARMLPEPQHEQVGQARGHQSVQDAIAKGVPDQQKAGECREQVPACARAVTSALITALWNMNFKHRSLYKQSGS